MEKGGCAFLCFVVYSQAYNGPVGAIARLYKDQIPCFLQVMLLVSYIGKLVI
jgi:hypothetical protein